MSALSPQRLMVTDTVAQRQPSPPWEVHTIAPLLADAIGRLNGDRSIDDLRVQG